MHSMIYKTELLRNADINLPKHTFYVDNLFVYKPLPLIKTFRYLNINFYRYYIGRSDQSVAESVIMNRIDQHIKVTYMIIDAYRLSDFEKTVLYDTPWLNQTCGTSLSIFNTGRSENASSTVT